LIMKNTSFVKIKPRSSKQIVQAGLTLGVGMIALPFISFKKVKNYRPFKHQKLNLKKGRIK
jgi:hypothetical protein